MLSERLKKVLRDLPKEDKMAIVDYINTTLSLKLSAEERCTHLKEVMKDLTGEDILAGNRGEFVVWYRAMIAYQMRREGYTTKEIGRELGKDHSTIIHLNCKMQDALQFPSMYFDIMPTWNRFKKTIEDETDGEPIQVN